MKLFVMCAVVCASAIVACSEPVSVERPIKPVSTAPVGEAVTYTQRTFTGVVQPSEHAQLNFEVGGVVEAVFADLGEAFASGDVLAVLEQIDYRLAVEEREAQLSAAQAVLAEAENDFQRKGKLVDTGALSESAFDAVRSRFESSRDQVTIAQTRLDMARENLADTSLKAPYGGTVTQRMIEPSQSISPNTPAFSYQGNSGLEVSLLVPETMLPQLEIDMTAQVDIPALGSTVEGSIKEIGTAARNASAYPVILRLDTGEEESLRPGMSAEVVFALSRTASSTEGFQVSVNALSAAEDDSYYVFKVISNKDSADADGATGDKLTDADSYRVQQVPVEVLQFYEQHAIISGSLIPTDRIVDAGAVFLRDGQQVAPIEAGIERYNP